MSRLPSLSDSRGFTLMELVVAMALGMIVLLASFTLMDRSFFTNKDIQDRVDALSRGRIAMEQMTRQIRSMTCVGSTPPIASGDANSISFYAYLGNPTTGTSGQLPTTSQVSDLHTFTYSATANTIVEKDYHLTSTNPITAATTPYLTRTLLTNVGPLPGATGVFSYAAFAPDPDSGSGTFTSLDVPLDDTTIPTVVQVSIGYVSHPTGKSVSDTTDQKVTSFQDDVFWRAADPENPTSQPCQQL